MIKRDIKIQVQRLQDIRVMLSRLYRDNKELHKDIELMLFYIYQDWDEVKKTIKMWKQWEL